MFRVPRNDFFNPQTNVKQNVVWHSLKSFTSHSSSRRRRVLTGGRRSFSDVLFIEELIGVVQGVWEGRLQAVSCASHLSFTCLNLYL